VTDLPLEGLTIEQPSIDAAIRRLTSALNELEAVVERRQENDRGQDNLAARIQALGTDRSRLADELDMSMSRSRSLEDANRNIAERIDGAIETIRAVLKSEQQP
jgi:predicted transcriptional regulator